MKAPLSVTLFPFHVIALWRRANYEGCGSKLRGWPASAETLGLASKHLKLPKNRRAEADFRKLRGEEGAPVVLPIFQAGKAEAQDARLRVCAYRRGPLVVLRSANQEAAKPHEQWA